MPNTFDAWIGSYPDMVVGVPAGRADPSASFQQREPLELAFVAALQVLPARQRAALILCEVLQGFRSEAQAQLVERALSQYQLVALSSPDLAIKAAANYRLLRRRGITIRKTIDVIVGTFCIERGHALLHSDRDFEPMERYLGLQTV